MNFLSRISSVPMKWNSVTPSMHGVSSSSTFEAMFAMKSESGGSRCGQVSECKSSHGASNSSPQNRHGRAHS
eukprot:4818840-Karenia_brevis.AAC.1